MKNAVVRGSMAVAAGLLMVLAVPGVAQAQETDAGTALTSQASNTGLFVLQREIPVVLVDEEAEPARTNRVAVQPGGGRGWYIGVRGGAYFDADEPFVGVELLAPLGGNLWFNPNFEWVFVEGIDVASLNADLHYDLDSEGPYTFWLGAGLGMRYTKLERPNAEGDWDPGLNLLAGMGFGGGSFIPYVQAKYYVGDFNEFVLAGGFRF